MRKICKRTLAVLLAVLMLGGAAPAAGLAGIADWLSVTAAAETYSGNCGAQGSNVTWKLDTKTGLLTISGSGAMKSYNLYAHDYSYDVPWLSYRNTIQKVTIGSGVTNISNYAFYGCPVLTSVTIPDSVTNIGEYAFDGCTMLASVTIPNSVTNIDDGTFYGCMGLKCLTIPSNVTTIGNYAFCCTGLTNITIPNSVTSIGSYAFCNCSGLADVTIPNSITEISERLFSDCTNLSSVTIPNSVISIGQSAFSNTNLKELTIPNNITSIGQDAFNGCKHLTSVTIPGSVKTIGSWAFCYCTALKSVTISNGVAEVGFRAFNNCSNLTSVIIPNSVTKIGNFAFASCTELAFAHIPSAVTSIGDNAFSNCDLSFYICSDTENCYAKTYAQQHSVSFRVCNGKHEPAHVHSYTSAVTRQPTCTMGGIRTYTCSACGNSYTEPIEKKPHTPKAVTEPATCMADGRQYTKCSVCEEILGEITVLPKIDHAFGEWVTVTEATMEAKGLRERVCTYGCGTKETEVLPKIPSKTVEDKNSGVTLTYPEDAYTGEVKLKIEQVFDGAAFNLVDLNSEQNVVFDITTVLDGVAVQPIGKVIVRIPVPEGFDPAKCIVYHVSNETGKLEKMNARYEDGCMVFETDHFSVYAVAIAKTISVKVGSCTVQAKSSKNLDVNVHSNGVGYKLQFDSSDTSVATVDQSGKVSAKKAGSTTITVTATDEFGNTVKDTCTVTVKYAFWQWLILIFLFGFLWY